MRLKYSLRTFAVLVALTSTMLAIWINRARQQKEAVEELIAYGAWVYFGDATAPIASNNSGISLHLFQSVELVTLRPTIEHSADKQLEVVAKLPSLEKLTIWPGQTGTTLDLRARGGLTDRGVQTLVERLSHIKHLGVTAADCSDESLETLKTRLSHTRYIHVRMRDPNREQLLVSR